MLELVGLGFYSVQYTGLWDKRSCDLSLMNGIIRTNLLSRQKLSVPSIIQYL